MTSPLAPGLRQIDELVVPYAYERITAEVSRRRSVVLMRVVSLCITALILIGLQLWRQLREVDSAVFGWPYYLALGVSLSVSAGFLAYAVVRWRRAKSRAATLRPEPVLVLARAGVLLVGEWVPWPAVTGLEARTRRFDDVFTLHRSTGPAVTVPFDLLDAPPSSLDSAARAFSGGRIGVDFSRMDN